MITPAAPPVPPEQVRRDGHPETPPRPPRSGPVVAPPHPSPSAAGSGRTTVTRGSVALLLLVDVMPRHRLWAFSRLALQGQPWRDCPGLRFMRALGSGHHGGFGLRPSATRQGLYLVFDDEVQARAVMAAGGPLDAYRNRTREAGLLLLRACSSRGSWGGHAMEVTAVPPATGSGSARAPIAALTRASIQARYAPAFWRRSPPAERALAGAPGCRLAVGLGEAPLLRQATFSLWDSAAAMETYARGGAHLAAIRAAYAGGYFSESMFVRYRVLEAQGCWHGQALEPMLAAPPAGADPAAGSVPPITALTPWSTP